MGLLWKGAVHLSRLSKLNGGTGLRGGEPVLDLLRLLISESKYSVLQYARYGFDFPD
jgi:hypothetical protein